MSIEKRWQQLQSSYNLSDHQLDQCKRYVDLLIAWNKKINLTAITKPEDIIALHFDDSLQIEHAVDMSSIKSVADIGTGAGFPGIPIKIKYPDISLYLIEVNRKKAQFLDRVIKELSLENVEVYLEDWRTFLRQTEGQIDLFCARASLAPKELIRMFKPVSPYKDATLVYWASGSWDPNGMIEKFISDECSYQVLGKKRKLIVMQSPK